MSDLLTNPLWRAEDLGRPIPDSPHAVSAALPTWRDVVGYEEADPRVIDALRSGYPRFVYHPLVRRLADECRGRIGKTAPACNVFPTRDAAERCANFIQRHEGKAAVHATPYDGACAVTFDEASAELARCYWQHTGEGISSRHAENLLNGATPPSGGKTASDALRRRIAEAYDADEGDVLLFGTGMAAIFTLYRALRELWPDRPAAQFGFPYVDTLKILQKFGPKPLFYPRGNAAELEQLASSLPVHGACGIFTEVPGNPLLASPDLIRLSALARSTGSPLVVDDTIATAVNVDCLNLADVVCTSLTKNFSGAGDVAGGAIVFNRDSRFNNRIRQRVAAMKADGLFAGDAVQLEINSRDFAERVRRCSTTANRLAEHLAVHPKVAQVFYPDRTTNDCYEQVRRIGGGYGALVSVVVRGGVEDAARFYDMLRVSKGPNLGTNYTLACPFTLLAHYRELRWAESCGVSRRLVRLSVGLEPADDLIHRLDEALSYVV